MRVFVTGATGFIGFAVVKELVSTGHQVIGLARSDAAEEKLIKAGARAHRGDIQNLDSLRRGAVNADGVVHTAFFHAISHMSLPTRLQVLMGGKPSGIGLRFMQASIEADRAAIETLASVMKSHDRSLVAAFPTMALKPAQVAREDDSVDPGAPGFLRGQNEASVRGLGASGFRSSIVRLPPVVHGAGDRAGLLPRLFTMARKKGASAYIERGENRWPAVHVLDAARLFRLALESGVAGCAYHAVAEEGIAFRQIAEVIGKQADVPIISKPATDAGKLFSFLAPFVATDNPVSSASTRQLLDWRPTQPAMISDVGRPDYFGS